MALRQIGDTQLAVTGTAAGIAAAELATSGVLKDAQLAVVQHFSGDPVTFNCLSSPAADGSDGSLKSVIGDRFEVWGNDDIRNFKAILFTGGAAAKLNILLFGGKI